jgi:hypothetical protein
MTIAEEISSLRETFKQHIDDYKLGAWEDSYIYSMWKKFRAVAIKESSSTHNMQTFCMELELSVSHECDCVPYGCKVLKSKHPLPAIISGKFYDSLRVMTLGNDVIGYMEGNESFSMDLDPIKGKRRRYSISNNHIVIWNDLSLKAIQVRAPWEDPLEWLTIHLCADGGGIGPCYDYDTIDAGITEEQSARVLKDAIKTLFYPLVNIPTAEKEDQHIEK